jgi:hypothetical protein
MTEGVLFRFAKTHLAIQPLRLLSAFQFDSAARGPRKPKALLIRLPIGIGSEKSGRNSALVFDVPFLQGHCSSRRLRI